MPISPRPAPAYLKGTTMDEALLALRCGRLSPTAFFRRTRSVWLAMANALLRRWRCPTSINVEDVCQELMLNAWIFAGHWDPKRSVTISRYVIYNCTDKAKKWMHQQRNAYRRDDKAAPRFERPVSSLNLSEYAEEHLFDSLAHAASQEDAYAQRQLLTAAVLRAPAEHVPAMVALARTGDIDLAAEQLKQSIPACVALRLESVADARLAVTRAISAVA